MTENFRQSSSLSDQLRWQHELNVSRWLQRQRSPGFFPGPGAEASAVNGNTAVPSDARSSAGRQSLATGGTADGGAKGDAAQKMGSGLNPGSAGEKNPGAYQTGSMGETLGGKKGAGGAAAMAAGGGPGTGPGGMTGGMPGGALAEAYGKGGDTSEQAMRMGAAAGAEAAGAVGKAFGPEGEAAGKVAGEAMTGGAEAVIAAKSLLQGGGPEAVANALKKNLDTYVWPCMSSFITGIVALPVLQFYWFCSIAHFPWTVRMRMWEHIVLGFATAVELFLLLMVLTLLSMMTCLYNFSTCGIQQFGNLGSSVISLIKL